MSYFVGGLQNILVSGNSTRADVHINDIIIDGTLQPELKIDYNDGDTQLCLSGSDNQCNVEIGVDTSNNMFIKNEYGGGAGINVNTQGGRVNFRTFDTTDLTTNFKVQNGDGATGYNDIFEITENAITTSVNIFNTPPAWEFSNGTESIQFNNLSNEITMDTQNSLSLVLSQSETILYQPLRILSLTKVQTVSLATTLTSANNGQLIYVTDFSATSTQPFGRMAYFDQSDLGDTNGHFWYIDDNSQV